jgi:methylated-DNA-[protein]-cysteine S-methyltransferase
MKTYINSPVGRCVITGMSNKITSVRIEKESTNFAGQLPSFMALCAEELRAYFHDGLETFNTDILLEQGTEFQQNVWSELLNIPYGRTTTYLKIAEKVSNKDAVRAVGNSIGRNPFAILVPCHRVIGTDGSMTGFAYGIETKRWLLELENSKLYGKQHKLF